MPSSRSSGRRGRDPFGPQVPASASRVRVTRSMRRTSEPGTIVVSLLEDVAERLFNLIHAKDTANIHVKWCIEFCDADDETFVFDIFCGQSAKLFLDAAALYRCMSEQLGWSEEKLFDQYKAMMREEVERLEAIQADRAASRAAFHQELFGDLTERQNS